MGWDNPRSFTLRLLDEILRETRRIAAPIVEEEHASALPKIDTALALGRLAGLTGVEEVVWLRACLKACAPPEDDQS